MKKNYFQVMSRCVLASLSVLIVASILKAGAIFTTIGAVAPLVYYHLFYLRPQAKNGLSQTAIDSVYYFGFLVTVAALGISAVAIASGGAGANVNAVVYQFGIGLFATGYAVVARMHLSSISTMVEEASPEAIMDRYVKRSMELVTNVEMACEQLSVFSESIMKKTADVSEATRVNVEKTMLETAQAFRDEMKSTLVSAKDSLTTVRGLVNDTSFVAERKEMAAHMRATVEGALALNNALNELTKRTQEGAQATKQISISSADFSNTLSQISANIEDFAGKDGVFAEASKSLQQSSNTFVTCNVAMADASVGLSEIAQIVSDTGPTFKNMRTLTKKASEQLDGLAETSTKLDLAVEKMLDAARASDSLAEGMTQVVAALSPLTVGAENLTARLIDAAAVSNKFEQQLSTLPAHAQALKSMNEEVADSFDQICEVIEEAAEHAKSLSTSSVESVKAIDAANKILNSASTLESSILSLQNVIDGLSSSVIANQKALAESASGIKSSIARSSEALEGDVGRSAKAATLLTERLAQVAQNIIDRTRQPERVE